MKIKINEKIVNLAKKLDKKLYIVGGYVRNYLINSMQSNDIDLAGNIDEEVLKNIVVENNYKVIATYKKTGTLVFSDEFFRYEYTRFRSDSYLVGGNHTPNETFFTDDINIDAKRRDFKCNAVYYDLSLDEFVDPLNGIKDIKNKVLDTVDDAKIVFSHDGLRLLRLARFSGELDFTPTKEVLIGAMENRDNIVDIAPERIFSELKAILVSDTKYPFSNKCGGYKALKILDETRVLDKIIPELTLGRNMEQRKDFHNYDVLEHTLRTVKYADSDVRLEALFHDIGKPYCMINEGKYHRHAIVGKTLARDILNRLKASKKEIESVCFCTVNHMLDLKGDMKESKIKRFIALNNSQFDKLMKIKQADFSACKDNLSKAPSVERWEKIYKEMKKGNVPLSIKDLKITGQDLIKLGVENKQIGQQLEKLFYICIDNPKLNEKERLIKIVKNN